jgi:ATP citrate (pro-S)-lyase
MQCATADPDGRKRALLIGGGIANFTDVAATFNGIIRALREKVYWTARLLALESSLMLCFTWHHLYLFT